MRELKTDINALDGVYELTSRGVYLLAYSILKNPERAKDIMQDTFLRVTANIDKYKPNTNAYAWILRIARNLSYRTYTNDLRSSSIEAIEEQPSKETDSLWTASIDLNKAMMNLTAQEREIVTLFSIEGYKHREIAQIVEKPMGTVQWMYNKAIKKLQEYLKEPTK